MSRNVFLAAVGCLVMAVPLRAQDVPAVPPAAPTVESAAPEKPLPDLPSLIARAKANQAFVEELRKSYICKMTQVADEFSSNGSKKSHTDVYQVFFVDKFELHQHMAHDGLPLSDENAKKEQQRIDKEIAEIKDGKRKSSGGIRMGPSTLLKVATLSAPRRIELNGRPTIVFDYTGNPKAQTSNMGEEVARKLSGTLWIDEKDATVARLNGHLDENYHIGGGLLVNIKKGSHFELTQMPVNGEIWFGHTIVAHAEGRFLLFKGFDGDANITFSEYQKMKTTVTILPGTGMIGPDGQPLHENQPPASSPADTPQPR